MTMSRVMVCGGAGFVGSYLVERLLADGHDVDVVDDLSTGSLANLATARSMGAALRFHHLDVTSLEFGELVGLRNPDVIYNLAILQPSASDSLSITRSLPTLLGVLEAALDRLEGEGKTVAVVLAGGAVAGLIARHMLTQGGAPPGAPLLHSRKARPMDYGKNGNPKIAKDSHHPLDQPRRGAPKGDDAAARKKAELLARMKAAAEARKPKP